MFNIFVYIEDKNSIPRDVSLELLSKAREMVNNFEGCVCAIYPKDDLNNEISEMLFRYGADKVYFIKHERLNSYNELYFSASILQLLSEKKADVLLFGATKIGRSLAPKISSSLAVGLTADCTELDIIEKNGELKLASTRPTFGGSLMATILSKTNPQMATVREHTFKKKEKVSKGITEEFIPNLSETETSLKIIEFLSNKKKNADTFLGADLILGGGLGLGSIQNFEKLKKLAILMNASYGATRSAVDKGFVSKDRQIGQTGKTIAPKIYIAFGISGAVQHLCGVENSDYIIAINNDKNAPIFSNCDLGIVGDANQIIDNLIFALNKTL